MITFGSNRTAAERMGFRHALQREIGRLVAPLWVPLAVLVMRFGFGYRIERLWEIRQEFKRIRRETTGPLLICANHLTMVDSFLIAWALAPTWRYVLGFDLLPWNTPERTNFAATRRNRILTYLAKCIPITRGGRRDEVAAVLDRVIHLTSLGEYALLFPEGGRSRTGRVEADTAAWGVGRIVGALPCCRVLCVYMRGDDQETWSELPKRGEHLVVDIACIEPKSDARGVRRSVEFSHQIVAQLAQMERKYLARRQ
jgi:hypothetical protein